MQTLFGYRLRKALLSSAIASCLATGVAAEPAQRPAATIEIANCGDHGPGSLRDALVTAADGDTIDLSALTCGHISLVTGRISAYAHDLTIRGPGETLLTITGRSMDEVFDFSAGSGTTTISDLTISYGLYDGGGGCVFVGANANLERVTLSHCKSTDGGGGAMLVLGSLTMDAGSVVDNISTDGDGGGIAVDDNAYISHTSISHNSAYQPPPFAPSGGGLSVVNYLRLTDSDVEGNYANSNAIAYSSRGGGVAAFAGANIVSSTISYNETRGAMGANNARGGGVYLFGDPINVQYSTIAGNQADGDGGGGFMVGNSALFSSVIAYNFSNNNSAVVLDSYVAGQTANLVDSTITANTAGASSAIFAAEPLLAASSTIAFNFASGTSAGLYLYPGGDADLESTIIANNTSYPGPGFDLVSRASVSGTHNLIQVSAVPVPPDTIVATDPMLMYLADNGGATMTLALVTGSPAIDAGSNFYDVAYDQRGPPYARMFGAAADIGAFEYQTIASDDAIFSNGFD